MESGISGEALLDDLDKSLAAQIEEINRQRALIASLREHRASIDTPPELAKYYAKSKGVGERIAQTDRYFSLVIAHFIDDKQMPELIDVLDDLSLILDDTNTRALNTAFDLLEDDSSEEEIERCVNLFVSVLGEYLPTLNGKDLFDFSDTPIGEMLDEYIGTQFNTAQQRAFALIMTGEQHEAHKKTD
jgi:hypothetical protein